MIRVGIAGATGYTGLELMRILAHHPQVRVVWATSESSTGMAMERYCPAWQGRCHLVFEKLEMETMATKVDVVFLGFPQGVSMDYVPVILPHARVIDLGADFRIKNRDVYEMTYGIEHRAPSLLPDAVYGIPEIYRDQVKSARIVANPGCFPTSIILPLYPLLKEGVIEREVIVDSKSGVTGAGKKATEATHFCEVDENFKAYKVGEHRHQPEIQEQLSLLAGETVGLVFTPHLLPLRRGILSTIYCTVGGKITESDLFALWNRYYHHEPWVRIHSSGSLPELKWVLGSNFCDMGMKKVDEKHLVVVSVIDNLTKGASGQAVQNMNVMFGIDERIGLPDSVLYP